MQYCIFKHFAYKPKNQLKKEEKKEKINTKNVQ